MEIILASTSSIQITHIEFLTECLTHAMNITTVSFIAAAVSVKFRKTAWYITDQNDEWEGAACLLYLPSTCTRSLTFGF